MTPMHTGIDHLAYSAMGAGIAIEWSGTGDLPWTFYVVAVCVQLLHFCWRKADE